MTVWSYAGELRLSIYACPVVVPDAERLGDYFADALDELLAAVESSGNSKLSPEPPEPTPTSSATSS